MAAGIFPQGYAQAGSILYVLLISGNKRAQDADIKEAQALWKELQGESK